MSLFDVDNEELLYEQEFNGKTIFLLGNIPDDVMRFFKHVVKVRIIDELSEVPDYIIVGDHPPGIDRVLKGNLKLDDLDELIHNRYMCVEHLRKKMQKAF